MKKIYLFSAFIAGLLTFNSCNNEPDFPGLDEASQITNVAKYVTSYAGAIFSEDNPAKTHYLAGWIRSIKLRIRDLLRWWIINLR